MYCDFIMIYLGDENSMMLTNSTEFKFSIHDVIDAKIKPPNFETPTIIQRKYNILYIKFQLLLEVQIINKEVKTVFFFFFNTNKLDLSIFCSEKKKIPSRFCNIDIFSLTSKNTGTPTIHCPFSRNYHSMLFSYTSINNKLVLQAFDSKRNRVITRTS